MVFEFVRRGGVHLIALYSDLTGLSIPIGFITYCLGMDLKIALSSLSPDPKVWVGTERDPTSRAP